MKKVTNQIRLIFIFLCLTNSIHAHGAQPGWLINDSSEYPSNLYLIGRGVGATEDEASNRARGDLATVFEVRIQVATESVTTVVKSGSQEKIAKRSSQQVSATSDKIISGISIAQIWRDPVSQDVHALAVLSRVQASTGLKEEMVKLDNEVQHELQAAIDNSDPLLRIGKLLQARKATIKREGLQAMLRVIDQSGRGFQSGISQASVQVMIDDAIKLIRITPEVEAGVGSNEFGSILKGGLAAAGFLATSHAEADLVLEGKLILTDLGRREGWNWMRATAEVTLVEKVSRRVRGTKSWPVKASAQDAKTARLRVMAEVEKALKQDLRSAILGFAS